MSSNEFGSVNYVIRSEVVPTKEPHIILIHVMRVPCYNGMARLQIPDLEGSHEYIE
jgi:hypothetical protein